MDPVPAYLSEEWTSSRPLSGVVVSWSEGDVDISEAFDRLRTWQDHRCAMCGSRATGEPSLTWASPLLLDHDGSGSGLVRGFLCDFCNIQEGRAPADDPLWKLYRERPPAHLVGLRVSKSDLYRILANQRPLPRSSRRGRPATRPTLLGRQPALDHLRRSDRTTVSVAQRLGIDVNHLYGVLNGQLYPSHEVVRRLTAFLAVPITELFTPEALAHLHEVRPGRPARPLAPGPYAVDDLALRADRPRGRPPRLPRDLPRPLPTPLEGSDET